MAYEAGAIYLKEEDKIDDLIKYNEEVLDNLNNAYAQAYQPYAKQQISLEIIRYSSVAKDYSTIKQTTEGLSKDSIEQINFENIIEYSVNYCSDLDCNKKVNRINLGDKLFIKISFEVNDEVVYADLDLHLFDPEGNEKKVEDNPFLFKPDVAGNYLLFLNASYNGIKIEKEIDVIVREESQDTKNNQSKTMQEKIESKDQSMINIFIILVLVIVILFLVILLFRKNRYYS